MILLVVAFMKHLNGFFFVEPFEQNYWPDILHEVYVARIYEPLFNRTQKDVCVEVGANVGLVTYYLAKRFKTVYALEPSQQHFDTLSYMVEFNKLKNVFPLKLALMPEDKQYEFYHSPNQTMFSARAEVKQSEEIEQVQGIRLDTLFDTYDIKDVDFLKLDVEGSEVDICGGEGFANAADKIKTVGGEYHTWSRRHPNQLRTSFTDRGFDFAWNQGTQAQTFSAWRRGK